ncbi:hypothetical protein K503DRAFT_750457 [Rhizopogon vinicolor AM-OR11-026]|uniref:Glycosyl transferase CAP10 domain-containing protein n=1 Tax=Rhizopogon vinicolor AM-OR11-026 TaxID=1314800 RepID=A0A1B7MGM9_9AGAM|nr:hypothetical protein K503DRAFT_750457 [Rhizopogon vinicolor AM-OR11-026]
MSVSEAGKYKYVLDMDGNGWSSQFKRLIAINALTFKSTNHLEWYTASPPWVNYVPIQNAYSDLYNALVFFRSDLAVRGACGELVAKIVREGMEWTSTFCREEDMVAHLFRCVRVALRFMP